MMYNQSPKNWKSNKKERDHNTEHVGKDNLFPHKALEINKESHQFRDGHGWMCVIKLYGNLAHANGAKTQGLGKL